jgi:two-component system alkaline phosphatase synthesis response regulator PhoP
MTLRETVLVVDDELNVRKAIGVALQREGYHVLEAGEGQEAVQTILRDMPELILLDIMLPGMNGYDVALRLRDDPRTKQIPIIMVSAKTQVADRLHGLAVGADDYITKPFDLRELVARVNTMMRRTASLTQEPAKKPHEWNLGLLSPPRDMTFDSFITGPANREAYEAAVAVAKEPGAVHNPLFFYGEAGTGKTHLLAAVVNDVCRRFGPNAVAYTALKSLEESIRKSPKAHEIERLFASFKEFVLVAVDDIHLLNEMESDADMVLEAFTGLCDRARQIVVCGDKPISQLRQLSRVKGNPFARSTVVRFHVPTPYHRGRILRAVADGNSWSIPEPSLLYLARRLTTNIRTLLSVAERLANETARTGMPITTDLIDEVIAQLSSSR